MKRLAIAVAVLLPVTMLCPVNAKGDESLQKTLMELTQKEFGRFRKALEDQVTPWEKKAKKQLCNSEVAPV